MKRHVRLTCVAAAVWIAAAPPSAYAHHSHPAFYDQCKVATIEGRVISVEWKNPHVLIALQSDDGTTYRVEWGGMRGLTAQGLVGPAQEALGFGERIVVIGNPLRDAAQIRARFPGYAEVKDDPAPKILDPLHMRRVDAGWTWALTPSPSAPDCDRK